MTGYQMNIRKAAKLRASSSKKTEAYPFRYNIEQRKLLHFASEVSGKPIQRILEDSIWEALEEQYGHSVPIKTPRGYLLRSDE